MASASDNEMSNAHNITHVSNTEDCDLINSSPKVTPSPVSNELPQLRSKCTPDTSKTSIYKRFAN